MEDRRFYGETLLSMLEYGAIQRNVVCTSSLCNPKNVMKRRLMNLMNEKRMTKPVLALSLVTAIALAGSGGATAYAAGLAVPTTVPKKVEGVNVIVENPDGTAISFDKSGNRVPTEPKGSYKPKKLTPEEMVNRIKKHIEKGLTVPQDYIDNLPQKDLDAINETNGFKLQRSKEK